jgi:murein L,D-transpeptidase YcbB/YkuD
VPLIRSRFGLDGAQDAGGEELVYDSRVATAVADFQRGAGLPASGTLTARTIAALSGGDPAQLEAEIVSNMERWRWLPRDLGADRIEVNIPDYALKVTRGGEIVHRARVVVGKPQTQTPVFSDAMRFLVVNPSWHVPQSIVRKEMLPKLASDPTYLSRQGYEVIQQKGQTFVRQPPGERNALGRVKFMFPNEHSVYLHDTPSRHLFAHAKRAYSHGCVRVDQPFAFAETVLGREEGWSEDRLKKMIGDKERTVRLSTPLPIHIQYFTVSVEESGQLRVRDDIYGHSRKLRAALGFEA